MLLDDNIIYKYINDKFIFVEHDDLKITIMIEYNYVNATKLCNDYGKSFDDWLKNENVVRFISNINKEPEPVISINNENEIINGVYVGDLLLPYIVSWIFDETSDNYNF